MEFIEALKKDNTTSINCVYAQIDHIGFDLTKTESNNHTNIRKQLLMIILLSNVLVELEAIRKLLEEYDISMNKTQTAILHK